MGKKLMAAVAVTALALAACGDDDDADDETAGTEPATSIDESTDPRVLTCDAFTLEDAEALLGQDLVDRSDPPGGGPGTHCEYHAGDDDSEDSVRLEWVAVRDPDRVGFDGARDSLGVEETLDGIGDEAYLTPANGAHAYVDGVYLVAVALDAPADDPSLIDREMTLTVLRALVEAVEAQG